MERFKTVSDCNGRDIDTDLQHPQLHRAHIAAAALGTGAANAAAIALAPHPRQTTASKWAPTRLTSEEISD